MENCPYCDAKVEINHDDGYGYAEGVLHQQQCGSCQKYFVFQTSIVFYYDLQKADCLNGSNHDLKPTTTYPKEFTKMECIMCGDLRELTSFERTALGIEKPIN